MSGSGVQSRNGEHRVGVRVASFQSVNTVVLQQATEPSMQGRVMALHQMAWFGSTPIGALLMGWIIQISSPRVPFALAGLSALLCAAATIAWPTRPVPAPAVGSAPAAASGS